MTVPKVVLKTSARQYSKLVNLGNRVIGGLTGNGNFATPALSLVALQAAITDVTNAIGEWGPVGNHGSHEDLLDLRAKSLTLWQLLKAEADYVQTTATVAHPLDYATLATV